MIDGNKNGLSVPNNLLPLASMLGSIAGSQGVRHWIPARVEGDAQERHDPGGNMENEDTR